MPRRANFLLEGSRHVANVRDDSWMLDAACATWEDPELWTHVHDHAGHASCQHALARHVCREHCPVKAQCLEKAMEFPEQWGGMVIGGYYWGARSSMRSMPDRRQPEFRRTCRECRI